MEEFIFGDISNSDYRHEQTLAGKSGVKHIQKRCPYNPAAGESVVVSVQIGPKIHFQSANLYWTNDGTDPVGCKGEAVNGKVTQMKVVATEWDADIWGYIRIFEGEIPAQEKQTVVRYRIGIDTPQGEIFADDGTYYAYFVGVEPSPAWVSDAIIYQIFVDRFSPGEDKTFAGDPLEEKKSGGTLRGIIERLDYLDELGINTLWLTPIFTSPTYHRYNASDLFQVDPDLGSDEDFDELLQEAHARGIRLLLDCVPNHVSDQHLKFKEACSDRESDAFHWFTFVDWPEQYVSFFDVPDLPQLNLRYPPAKKYLLDSIRYWLERGVDGFRVDYVLGPTPDFWADFRQMTRQANPDCWTFGEAVEMPIVQRQFGNGLDGCLDFMLLEGFRETFALGRMRADAFGEFLTRHYDFFPDRFSLPSFLDNHDMNRFITVSNNDIRRLKLAAICQFTLPGQPIIYYGTESGLGQPGDMTRSDGNKRMVYARQLMNWDSIDSNLFHFYQTLIQLRKTEPDLRKGAFSVVSADDALLVYERGDIVVAIHVGDGGEKTLPIRSNTAVLFCYGSYDAQTKKLGSKSAIIIKKSLSN